MNKKVLTLCAGLLLAGMVVPAEVSALTSNATAVEARAPWESVDYPEGIVAFSTEGTYLLKVAVEKDSYGYWSFNQDYSVTQDKTGGVDLNKGAEWDNDPEQDNAYWTIEVVRGGYSFKNQEGRTLSIDDETVFTKEVVYNWFYPTAAFYLKVNGQYVVADQRNNSLTLGDSRNAVAFGIAAVGLNTLTVGELNFYNMNSFEVTITDGNENALTEDVFTGGPLTPMTLSFDENDNAKFTEAEDGEYHFWLKNSDGDYIVAVKHQITGASSSQAIYDFEPIDEKTLIHELTRVKKENITKQEQTYFGEYRAKIYKYNTDVEELTQIDKLEVCLGDVNESEWAQHCHYATIGWYSDNNGKTTALGASFDFEMNPIHIALGATNIVDWTKFLQQGKFYTVTVKKAPKGEDTGIVAAIGEDKAGVVKSVGNPLEAQWAITLAEGTGTKNDAYVFTNRESLDAKFDNNIQIRSLYYTNEADVYRFGAYTLEIKPVAKHEASDGYDKLNDLKNTKFNIGFSSSVFDNNAWFIENHEGVENHEIGLSTDIDEALIFTAEEHAGKFEIKEDEKTHLNNYIPTDSIYVISTLGYYNEKTKKYDTTKDTLKVVSYSFTNQYGEPLIYNDTKDQYESNTTKKEIDKRITLHQDGEKLNLRPVYAIHKTIGEADYNKNDKMYQEFTSGDNNSFNKIYAGDAADGILDNVDLYDRTENDLFVISETAKPMYHRVATALDTVSLFLDDNNVDLLYESKGFLAAGNSAQLTDMAPAMIADTAYVRYDTYRPQYMLVVGATIHPEDKWCPEHGLNANCGNHLITLPEWVDGRYLVNLKDSAVAWDKANKHEVGNPFTSKEGYHRLGFVQAAHRNDSLIVAQDNNRIYVGDENFNMAKFAFRYVDATEESFVIETANYAEDGTANGTGFLMNINGTIVVTDDINEAEVFGINEEEEGTPTANEAINAEGAISVTAIDGAVVIKGAEGKNVVIATILGKVVANETVSSDNETIAVPAGIAVVSVDGESFKVVVK